MISRHIPLSFSITTLLKMLPFIMCKMFLQSDLFKEGLKHFQDFHCKAPPLQILFKVKFIFFIFYFKLGLA